MKKTIAVLSFVVAASASANCVDKVYSDAGYDRAKAATACGSATPECIDRVYADAGYDRVKAARICSAQNP